MNQKQMDLGWGLVFGIVFGFLLQKSWVTHYDVILGQLLLRDFTVLKVMLSAVIVGMYGIHWLQRQGRAKLSPRSGSWGKNAIGGLIFGFGFAISGYCPGTIAGAIGNGYLDAVVGGLTGILLGSALLAAVYPRIKDTWLKMGTFPQVTLPQLFKVGEWMVIVPLSLLLVLVLVLLEMAGL